MNLRDEVVAEARDWLGTPYRHQASAKGLGCDCLGLLRGVWRHVYGAEPEAVPAYSMDWDEVAHREVLREAAGRHLETRPLADCAPGDVLLFRMRAGAVAKHVGIVSGVAPVSFIHAYAGHGVVESALSAPWARRLDAVFAFPARAETHF